MRYETQLTFQIADLNDQLKEGYFDLFEAVWTNDVEKVKALTLSSWKGSDGAEHAPLKIAVTDGVTASMKTSTSTPFVGFFPFSLAVLRSEFIFQPNFIVLDINAHQYRASATRGNYSQDCSGAISARRR